MKAIISLVLVIIFFIGCYFLGNYSLDGSHAFHAPYLLQFFGMIIGFFIVALVCVFALIGYGLYKFIVSNI